ncbi:uncharacterized protein LOC143765420 isoform X2 [Ranitomeya variabilis]
MRSCQKGARWVERCKWRRNQVLLLLLLLLPLKVLPDTPRVGGLVAAVGHQLHSVLPQKRMMMMTDIDNLIEEVREREPLWNMADRRHADTGVTRRLWDEVCRNLFPRQESLHPQQLSKLVGKVRKRWRSLRDRFKREFNEEMQAPSGSTGRRRSKYKYGPALSFLRRTMLSRVTFSSHRAPASSSAPSGAIPPESATEGHVGRPHTTVPSSDPTVPSSDPSVPSTSSAPSSGALLQASLLASDAEQLAFPLPHPSDPATSRPPLGSWRQRQRGPERSYAPEFLHLNASFQGFQNFGRASDCWIQHGAVTHQ